MEDLTEVYMTPLPDSPYVRPFRFNYTQGGKDKNWDMLEVHDSVAIIVFNVTTNKMIFVKQFRPENVRGSTMVKPLRLLYKQNEEKKMWDMIEMDDSFYVMLFNVTRRKMLFIQRFRPAIYYNSVPPAARDSDKIDTTKYPASLGVTLEMCAGIVDKNKTLREIAKEEVLEECGYDVPLDDLHKIISYRAGVGVQGSLQTLFYCEVTDDMKVGKGGGVEDEIIEVIEKSIPEVEAWISGPGPLSSPPSCLFAVMWFLRHKADRYRKSFERYCGECKIVQNDGLIATSSY